ncbi:Bifunctional uridylyltransferase/uridylyl-removing enzyme [Methyloligella halotolerans]|uniref:Bifunctional uridylyltransferase/uridylyl-removing enzyme n=1 Tax=Methyloligella halotolerans TaxID=1177755 RepID=A0A1E2S084_9HYPH|nr:[protein-PII] uridylyltransferase [Methyloligella halotolerans]ODA67881.1 Bifunctional uridylyltransferase/uridylyl-removing enzyme [Methyloligella halotolerans]
MDQKAIVQAPYFDFAALSDEMAVLAEEHAGKETALRAALVDRFKALMQEAHVHAERQLQADGDGVKCAENLSDFQDALIRLSYEVATRYVYRVDNPSSSERMAIVATGGYGRGRLAPGSDIDIMFLLPHKQTAWGESVAEFMLYLLWDLGLKVGHATRSIDHCVRLAHSDMTIRTALLDARLILGDQDLFADFKRRFLHEVLETNPIPFVDAKLEERNERHARSGASRYRVEPNIKEGKGGLRDLHTLHWLAKHLHPDKGEEEFVSAGVFSRGEYRSFVRCEHFLWTVRCHLHFLTGRAEERLTFDLQQRMAERLHYHSRGGLQAVERFMKHYFLVAKEVGDLTGIVCTALEMKQLKSSPALNALLAPFGWRQRLKVRYTSDFRIENGRIFADKDVFELDQLNLLRLFIVADRHQVSFSPSVLRSIRSNFRLIDDDLRENPAANKLFMQLLTESRNVEDALRKMNEAGVLGRFIPDFGRVVSMMQFNMYHHFTVDEHLIRTVGYLSRIENGDYEREHPLASEIINTIDNRRVLYVTCLLHDIAKGRDEDHSIAGAQVARDLCPRLGLTAAETETVAWLIEHHLEMSQYAQSRDLNDPKTIRAFADLVQSRERLKLLLILTVCDICAVGPGVWTGWKGQLLRTLYFETEPLLGGGTALSREQRINQTRAVLRERLDDWPKEIVERFIDRQSPDYWLRTDLDLMVEHAKLVREAEEKGKLLATHISTDAFRAVTQISILAPNHPRLLSMIAGACHRAGADIADAQISTTLDDMALDTIHLEREFDLADDEERRAGRIANTIEKLLSGELYFSDIIAEDRKPRSKVAAFTVEPQVIIDNTLSDDHTVIEVNGLDRPGLLYEITRAFTDLKLDIATAHIATFGEKAVDVFYVTDLQGNKIASRRHEAAIRDELKRVLAGETAQEPVAG